MSSGVSPPGSLSHRTPPFVLQYPLGSVPTGISNLSQLNSTINCTIGVGCFLRYSLAWTTGYCVAYASIFLLGIVGNGCVLNIIYRNSSMRTAFHLLLVNLAVADLLVVMFYLPATLVGHIFGPWILGLFICKAATYLQGVSVCASVHTLVAISIDRFLAICYPMKCQVTSRGCKLIVVAIWMASFLLLLPWLLYFRLAPMYASGDYGLQVCREVWPTDEMEVLYFVVGNLLLCYLLPLTIISICYLMIWRRVWQRKLPGEAQEQEVEKMIQRSKVKVVKMLLVVIVVFAASWLPLYAIFARIKIGDSLEEGSLEEIVINIIAPVAQWLGASNSCINPVLYAFFNSKFRAGFKLILLKHYCCRDIAYLERNQNEREKTFRSVSYMSRKSARCQSNKRKCKS